MADDKQLLINTLKAFNQPTDKVRLLGSKASESVPVPTVTEAKDSKVNLSDTFTVTLAFTGKGYDACLTLLIQDDGTDTPRARVYQQLIFIEGLTTAVEESFSNTTITPAFVPHENFRAQSFLRKADSDDWVVTEQSPQYTFV